MHEASLRRLSWRSRWRPTLKKDELYLLPVDGHKLDALHEGPYRVVTDPKACPTLLENVHDPRDSRFWRNRRPLRVCGTRRCARGVAYLGD